MSVLIRGMEIPNCCCYCPFEYKNYCMAKPSLRVESADRHPRCPLIPVPPHGRLIDVKSLENMHFTESMYDAESKLFVPFVEVASAIFDAPSIIPAEEVYGQHTDTAGNFHWVGTHSGEHTIKAEGGKT